MAHNIVAPKDDYNEIEIDGHENADNHAHGGGC